MTLAKDEAKKRGEGGYVSRSRREDSVRGVQSKRSTWVVSWAFLPPVTIPQLPFPNCSTALPLARPPVPPQTRLARAEGSHGSFR